MKRYIFTGTLLMVLGSVPAMSGVYDVEGKIRVTVPDEFAYGVPIGALGGDPEVLAGAIERARKQSATAAILDEAATRNLAP